MMYSKQINDFNISVWSQEGDLATDIWSVVRSTMPAGHDDRFGRSYRLGTVSKIVAYFTRQDYSDKCRVVISGPSEDAEWVYSAILNQGFVAPKRQVIRDYKVPCRRRTPIETFSECAIFGEQRVVGIDIDEFLRREALRELDEDW